MAKCNHKSLKVSVLSTEPQLKVSGCSDIWFALKWLYDEQTYTENTILRFTPNFAYIVNDNLDHYRFLYNEFDDYLNLDDPSVLFHKGLFDDQSNDDQIYLNFQKNTNDSEYFPEYIRLKFSDNLSYIVTDNQNYYDVLYNEYEVYNNNDLFSINYTKLLEDYHNTTDNYLFITNKFINTIYDNIDNYSLNYIKRIEEFSRQYIVAEYFSEIYTDDVYNFYISDNFNIVSSKSIKDSYNTTEFHVLKSGKSIADQELYSETTLLRFTPNFAYIVNDNLDHYRFLYNNYDYNEYTDTNTLYFEKHLNTTHNFNDIHELIYSKPIYDIQKFAHNYKIKIGKNVYDEQIINERYIISYTKPLEDDQNINENYCINYSKPLEDIQDLSDSYTSNYFKYLEEFSRQYISPDYFEDIYTEAVYNFYISDNFNILNIKNISDNHYFSVITYLEYNKYIFDTQNIEELTHIFFTARYNDDNYSNNDIFTINFNHPATENQPTNDIYLINNNKYLQESLNNSETCILELNPYTERTYFDSVYVGTSITIPN